MGDFRQTTRCISECTVHDKDTVSMIGEQEYLISPTSNGVISNDLE